MKKFLSASLLLIVTNVSFALPLAPKVCPKASAIAAFGIANIQSEARIYKDWWAATNDSNYATEQKWHFLIDHISAPTADEALKKANLALTTLTNPQGPTFEPRLKEWICTYQSQSNYRISTITYG